MRDQNLDHPINEPTLEEELAALGDDDVFDFANLTADETGFGGAVLISSALGTFGPRVKYYPNLGERQSSFSVSISDAPRVLASSVSDEVVAKKSPKVIEWVWLNKAELLAYWADGAYWMIDDVAAFRGRLRKLPSSKRLS